MLRLITLSVFLLSFSAYSFAQTKTACENNKLQTNMQSLLLDQQHSLRVLKRKNRESLKTEKEFLLKIEELEEENRSYNNTVAALRRKVEELATLLANEEARAARDKIAIAALGKSLNQALERTHEDNVCGTSEGGEARPKVSYP